ncbi:Cell wall-associated hydrolase, NlpC family [Streptosporangium canum]|uniref:Cell wall-associated hydrolase, NlpC family n=1 Tax=Streptosporangium canum TaxID=324952 RepID=A0A1I3YW59_9ACTN|nr:Cell wall-associated hydrolase, NlpC family [Streptosporangium canum]
MYGTLLGLDPNGGRGHIVLDRRTRVSGLIHEARQDLAYRPRIRYGPRRARLLRRAVPVVVLVLVAALTTAVVVVTQLPEQTRETVALRQSVTRQPVQERAPAVQPTQTPPPAVAPLTSIHRPNLFVVAGKPLRAAVVAKIAQVAGVRAVERADAAEVGMDGKRVQTLGVNPSTFRAYTPKPTARSDRLWRNVSAGEVAVSFVLGNDGGLSLGRSVTTAGQSLRVGAYATMGMGGIDAVVSRQTARALGIPENNALVVSAPKADSAKLRRALLRILPRGSQVATINPVLAVPRRTTWSAGAFMTAPQIKTALTAAIGKLGRPYVWGAEGPDTFDCSGLVQWAYAQAGIKVPRVTHQQFVSGPQIPLSQAQPGDLLFWRHDPTNPGYVSHVAIYWGNGKMLHAPRTGDVVKIVPVSTRNFAGAVRISPGVAARVR